MENTDTNGQTRIQLPTFGRNMREHFLLDPDFIQMNHGSFGIYPKAVQSALRDFHIRSEQNPEAWFRRDVQIELKAAQEKIASLIVAPNPDNLVFVLNSTTGINAILRSLVLQQGDRIVHFSTIYEAMRETIQFICDYSQGKARRLQYDINYPISDDKIVQGFEEFLDQHHSVADPSTRVRIALIDHVSSIPGVVVPLQRIVNILKSRNILVLVDGAHAIGQVPINLTKLAPDFYVTDCHKWLYTARGCAILYVDPKHQNWIHPTNISANYGQPSRFQDEFFWTGTMDYIPYLTVSAALKFRNEVGGETAIREYTHRLAIEGGKLLSAKFGTQVLHADEVQVGSMVNVELPLKNHEDPIFSVAYWIGVQVQERFNLYAPVEKHNGRWYIRCSAQIYTDLSDFEETARVFLKICEELNK